MTSLQTPVFQGTKPAVAPHLLEESYASAAQNVWVHDGSLQPLRAPAFVSNLPHNAKTLYRWRGTNWLTWTQVVDATESPVVGQDRLYFSQPSDSLRVADASDMLSGSPPYPSVSRLVGVPYPTVPPVVSIQTLKLSGSSIDYDELSLEDRSYVFTFVNLWNEESSISPYSIVVSCYGDSQINFSIPAVSQPSGYVPYNSVRVYRTSTGTESSGLLFVAEISLASAQSGWVDGLTSASLAEVAETITWVPPPAQLQGVVSLTNGSLAGYKEYIVAFSEPYVPYAWPIEYQQRVLHKVVAIASIGSDAIVLTKGQPVLFAGNTPASKQAIRIPVFQPCLSARSVCVFNGLAIYACPDGLMGIASSGEYSVITEKVLTPAQWATMSPATMRCVVHERQILVFSDAGSWSFSVDFGLMKISVTCDAVHYSGLEDMLYTAQGSALNLWNAGTKLTASWTSSHVLLPDQALAIARVHALAYTNTVFKHYIDGTLAYTKTVTSREPFRLPDKRGRRHYWTVDTQDVVVSAGVADATKELLA